MRVEQMKWKDKILGIAEKLHCTLEVFSEKEGEALRTSIREKFVDPLHSGWEEKLNGGNFLWDRVDSVSYTGEDWSWIDVFTGKEDVILFFEKYRDTNFYRFSSGMSVCEFLDEFSIDEFYLTNSRAEYLIFTTDFGELHASGKAAQWLEENV
ncbi:MAG: hypothetical protein H7A25_17815 [Leptospiraceae bacterium]|nr:hypothetical protein [Leptospiraceae bacterium]MCP5501765.1 hypothetical protein [Leptospiraceae bacterium]